MSKCAKIGGHPTLTIKFTLIGGPDPKDGPVVGDTLLDASGKKGGGTLENTRNSEAAKCRGAHHCRSSRIKLPREDKGTHYYSLVISPRSHKSKILPFSFVGWGR